MMFAEDNVGYLRGRLEGTVVRMGGCGTPLYVDKVGRGVSGNVKLTGKRLLPSGSVTAPLVVMFKDIDLKSPMLGNVNSKNGCIFLARMPLRGDWRQGLRPSNVRGYTRGVSLLRGCSVANISNAIYGKFVSLDKALEESHTKGINVGFSRKFSVDVGKLLWYKEKKCVGKIVKNKPELKKEYFWLKEMLDAAIN